MVSYDFRVIEPRRRTILVCGQLVSWDQPRLVLCLARRGMARVLYAFSMHGDRKLSRRTVLKPLHGNTLDMYGGVCLGVTQLLVDFWLRDPFAAFFDTGFADVPMVEYYAGYERTPEEMFVSPTPAMVQRAIAWAIYLMTALGAVGIVLAFAVLIITIAQ